MTADTAPCRYRLEPFKPAHALEIMLQPAQISEFSWHDKRAVAEQFFNAGNAFTFRSGDGRVLFCGGAVERHPGYANLWGMFALHKGSAMVKLQRMTCRFIRSLPHKRVDAFVADMPAARRWAELVGLTHETVLAGAAPDGGNLLVYRRIDT